MTIHPAYLLFLGIQTCTWPLGDCLRPARYYSNRNPNLRCEQHVPRVGGNAATLGLSESRVCLATGWVDDVGPVEDFNT